MWAVIMAGGGGTRLWPASRRSNPKQLLALGGTTSLLQDTWARLEGLVHPQHILVVTSHDLAEAVLDQLPALSPSHLLEEPVGRNTLPCVAWAAAEIARRDPHALQVVLPADHVIEPAEAFRDTLRAALHVASERPGTLVTLGIRPTYPATGFGYIEAGRAEEDVLGHEVLPVQRFVEKPDRARAEQFLRSGNYLWNSGAFLWSTETIVAQLQKHAPATWKAVQSADHAQITACYPSLAFESVDVGLMEKAESIVVLPISYLWSDVGSWSALDEVLAPDAQGNRVGGGCHVIAEEASNNVVYGPDGHLVALLGVEGLAVVHTPDATLVCPKDRAQEVRRLVQRLENEEPGRL
ncbi:MAG: mannose-1-phosphate guanylyltransferase [Planctomycetes bacterium]|nr:mannose-1-phosphate guanylyltransferase [Planctomycetota bacterium]MCB9910778.1 mannose-1-phosphate guanylyltransferase [Planctomycetota bacterium]MCB9912804.1 mannose-1-phosphate guanylyltransferase [Planctomycetota bacterium]